MERRTSSVYLTRTDKHENRLLSWALLGGQVASGVDVLRESLVIGVEARIGEIGEMHDNVGATERIKRAHDLTADAAC